MSSHEKLIIYFKDIQLLFNNLNIKKYYQNELNLKLQGVSCFTLETIRGFVFFSQIVIYILIFYK